MKNILRFLQRYKYEVLLLALVQHLFIGIFLQDLEKTMQQLFSEHFKWFRTVPAK